MPRTTLALASARRRLWLLGQWAWRLVQDTFGQTVTMFGAVAPGCGELGAGHVRHIRDMSGEGPITIITETVTGIIKAIGREDKPAGMRGLCL